MFKNLIQFFLEIYCEQLATKIPNFIQHIFNIPKYSIINLWFEGLDFFEISSNLYHSIFDPRGRHVPVLKERYGLILKDWNIPMPRERHVPGFQKLDIPMPKGWLKEWNVVFKECPVPVEVDSIFQSAVREICYPNSIPGSCWLFGKIEFWEFKSLNLNFQLDYLYNKVPKNYGEKITRQNNNFIAPKSEFVSIREILGEAHFKIRELTRGELLEKFLPLYHQYQMFSMFEIDLKASSILQNKLKLSALDLNFLKLAYESDEIGYINFIFNEIFPNDFKYNSNEFIELTEADFLKLQEYSDFYSRLSPRWFAILRNVKLDDLAKLDPNYYNVTQYSTVEEYLIKTSPRVKSRLRAVKIVRAFFEAHSDVIIAKKKATAQYCNQRLSTLNTLEHGYLANYIESDRFANNQPPKVKLFLRSDNNLVQELAQIEHILRINMLFQTFFFNTDFGTEDFLRFYFRLAKEMKEED